MHDDWQPPFAPWVRTVRYGPEWEIEWYRAWRVMRPHGRYPSLHVIDNLFDHTDRSWMRNCWDDIAALTRNGERECVGLVQDLATLGGVIRRIKVVRDTNTGMIVTVHNA